MAKKKKEPTNWDMIKQVPAVFFEYAKVSPRLSTHCFLFKYM